jgi:hypothetical protein
LVAVIASAVLVPGFRFQARCISAHHPAATLPPGQTSVEIWRSDTSIATFHWAWAHSHSFPPDPPFDIVEEPDPAIPPWIIARLIRWGPKSSPWPEPGFQDMRGYIVTRGWPFRCFWHEYDFSQLPPTPRFVPGSRMTPPTLAGAFELPEPLSVRRPLNRPGTWPIGIPYRPLWTGLAFNILVLTVAWWIVLVVPFALRDAVLGALRRRRGLCPACAYDLRATPASSPCPECGYISKLPRPPALRL